MKILFLIILNILFLLSPLFYYRYSAEPAVLVPACEGHKRPKRIDQLLLEDEKKWLEFLKKNEMEESEDCP
jgi:hypothetical protein